MKKLLSLILVALMVLPFGILATVGVSAAEEVIYVKDGATGNGSSADNALGSLAAANAVATAKTTDVTIKFVGTYTLDGTDTTLFVDNYYKEAAHTNKITWAGADASSKLIIKTDAAARYYVIGGEFAVKDLAIEIDGTKVFVLVTNLHDVTVETGVTVTNPNAASETISIYGALKATYESSPYYNADTRTHTANPTVTVKSGSFKQIVGYMGNASTALTAAKLGGDKTVTLNGKVTLNVTGADTYIYQLYPVCNSYNTVTDCDITLDGGIIGRFVAATDRKYSKGIVTYGPSGVNGTYTVYLTKNFDLAAQSALVGVELAGEFAGAICGATANDDFAGALDDAGLGTYILKADAEVFDAVNAETVKINKATFDDVKKVTAAADTTAAPETTEAPATTTAAPATTTAAPATTTAAPATTTAAPSTTTAAPATTTAAPATTTAAP
ncbi:MAG: hypothetical protein IJE84_06225, partial [Clostridia bacterium]|nr:hypothetical protein [Clostridia bacterium]